MKVTSVQLKNYRNYADLSLDFSEGTNVICGNNAQGKTNLLESIYYCGATKSFRSVRDKNLVNFGAKRFEIALGYTSQGREQTIRFRAGEGPREIYHNEVKKSAAAQMIGQFLCVLFAPEHLNLIKEGPVQRRKFLDVALCSLKPSYFQALIAYQKIISQKSQGLHQIDKGKCNRQMIEIYNQQLAKFGAVLIANRYEYCALLQEKARQFHLEISGGKEELTIVYEQHEQVQFGRPAEMENALLSRLEENISREIASGICLTGPHRDKIAISVNGQSARLYGSQGQQRSCVLSMKLAEAEIIYTKTGEHPVILLDDILSELDPGRQNYIIRQMEKKQVILTTCEQAPSVMHTSARVFWVENGTLTAKK